MLVMYTLLMIERFTDGEECCRGRQGLGSLGQRVRVQFDASCTRINNGAKRVRPGASTSHMKAEAMFKCCPSRAGPQFSHFLHLSAAPFEFRPATSLFFVTYVDFRASRPGMALHSTFKRTESSRRPPASNHQPPTINTKQNSAEHHELRRRARVFGSSDVSRDRARNGFVARSCQSSFGPNRARSTEV